LGGFLFITPNLLSFILLSEIVWISLYTLAIVFGIYVDSALLISWGLFLLCAATAESVVGLSLLMFKFILYHNIRDDYYSATNKNILFRRLGISFNNCLND
jgi:NADH:ubiquinone oxidoreductase subunit K